MPGIDINIWDRFASADVDDLEIGVQVDTLLILYNIGPNQFTIDPLREEVHQSRWNTVYKCSFTYNKDQL